MQQSWGTRKERSGAAGPEPGPDEPVGGGYRDGALVRDGAGAVGAVGASEASGGPRLPFSFLVHGRTEPRLVQRIQEQIRS